MFPLRRSSRLSLLTFLGGRNSPRVHSPRFLTGRPPAREMPGGRMGEKALSPSSSVRLETSSLRWRVDRGCCTCKVASWNQSGPCEHGKVAYDTFSHVG